MRLLFQKSSFSKMKKRIALNILLNTDSEIVGEVWAFRPSPKEPKCNKRYYTTCCVILHMSQIYFVRGTDR